MKAKLFVSALLALSAVTLVACGGDDDSTPAGDAGGTSGGDGDGDGDGDGGDAGGMGGMAGGGSGGMGGSMVAEPVPCGSKMCQQPTNPFAMFGALLGGGMTLPTMAYACCLDETAETCGISMTADGAVCSEPAEPDTRCPDFALDFELPIPGFELPPLGVGCCTANQCGIDGQLFGQGCVENGEAGVMLAAQPMFGELLAPSVPPARACDSVQEDGGPLGEDAGQ